MKNLLHRLKKVNIVCLFLAAILVFSTTVQASPELEESIKQKQEAIKQAEADKKKMQNSLTDVKKIVSQLQNEKHDLESYVTELDANLTEVEEKISELKKLISDKEEEIKTTTEELQEAERVEQEQYENMKARIKFLYEKGNVFYMELLFTSKDFGDFINKADYIEKLSEYDQNMLNEFKQNREYIETCKAELEAEQDLLNEAKAKVDEEQKNLEGLISSKEAEIAKYSGDISNKEQAIKEYEADIAAQNATISALEAAVAEERRKLQEENGGTSAITYDGGMFKWPAPSYTRISDDYGNRIHPTLGIEKFHNGIDLAAPGGSPILAAYDGNVVAASYNASMGNYVMINHGDGLYTIYMHASSLSVSTGQYVSRGDKIGGVGTTGRSTGNHLHFSVRLNGSYVSPWNYLSK